jgi:SAM-dependent methyltransferase
MRSIACPTCDLKDTIHLLTQELGDLGPVRLVRCRECGLGYLDPQPDPPEMAPFYAPEYYGGAEVKFVALVERLRGALARLRARRLAGGLSPASRILDVGCGDGKLLAAFSGLGHAVAGTERAPNQSRARAAVPGVPIYAGDLPESRFQDGEFNLCVFWHVLEHLHDPRASLAAARRVLGPGGRLVVAVPNLDSFQARWTGKAWFHLDLPRHLYHFTPKSLASLIESAGFRVQRIGHFSVEQNPFGILQSALNRWAGPDAKPNLLYELLKSRAGEAPWTAKLGQRAAYVLGMPPAVALATLESLMGRGGTIEAWARRDPAR